MVSKSLKKISDYRAALEAHRCNSKLISSYKNTLNMLETANYLSLIWIAGLSLMQRNEETDTYEKDAASFS